MDDLEAEAQRMEEHDYDRALDRKYHMARGVAARDMKAMYMEKIARHKPRRPRKD